MAILGMMPGVTPSRRALLLPLSVLLLAPGPAHDGPTVRRFAGNMVAALNQAGRDLQVAVPDLANAVQAVVDAAGGDRIRALSEEAHRVDQIAARIEAHAVRLDELARELAATR